MIPAKACHVRKFFGGSQTVGTLSHPLQPAQVGFLQGVDRDERPLPVGPDQLRKSPPPPDWAGITAAPNNPASTTLRIRSFDIRRPPMPTLKRPGLQARAGK